MQARRGGGGFQDCRPRAGSKHRLSHDLTPKDITFV